MPLKNIYCPLLLSSILVMLLSSCTSTNLSGKTAKDIRPKWINTMKHPKFPQSFYIIGVGYAQKKNENPLIDQKIADSSAMRSIAEQIRVNIKGIATDIQKETSSGDESSSMQHIEVITRLEVDIEGLEGISIPERYFDEEKNTYYSMAVLDRNKASFSINSMIDEYIRLAIEYYENARVLENKEIFSKSLQAYLKAHENLKAVFPKERLLMAITGNRAKKRDSRITIPQIERKIQDIASSIVIEKVSGDKQKGKISEPLKYPLAISVYYKKGASKIPMAEFPIKFSFEKGSGNLQEETVTNKDGITRSFVSMVIPSGVSRNVIEARLDYSKFTSDYDNFIPVKTTFAYTLPTKHDIKIFLYIEESLSGKANKNSIVEAELLKELREAEFNIVDKTGFRASSAELQKASIEQLVNQLSSVCDIAIIGTVEANKKSEFGRMFFAESRGIVKIIYIKNALVLKAINITPKLSKSDTGFDTKGAGLDILTAAQSSLTKIAGVIAKKTVTLIEEAFNAGFKSKQ